MSQTITFDDVLRLFHETGLTSQETKRTLQEAILAMQKSREETERAMQKSREETERAIKDLSRQVGSLSGKWGQFVENMVAPACEWLFIERGIPVHKVHQRVRAKLDDGRAMEVDILVINGHSAVLVEVKSTLTVEDVRDHLVRLEQFKLFYPEYQNRQIMGAVASIVMEEHANDFARKQGLFVIVQSGESVALANPPDFQPKQW